MVVWGLFLVTPYGHGVDEIQAGGPQAGGFAEGRWGEAGGGQGPYRHPKNPTAAVPPSKESHRHRTATYRRTATATQSRQKFRVFEHLRYITFSTNQPTSYSLEKNPTSGVPSQPPPYRHEPPCQNTAFVRHFGDRHCTAMQPPPNRHATVTEPPSNLHPTATELPCTKIAFLQHSGDRHRAATEPPCNRHRPAMHKHRILTPFWRPAPNRHPAATKPPCTEPRIFAAFWSPPPDHHPAATAPN